MALTSGQLSNVQENLNTLATRFSNASDRVGGARESLSTHVDNLGDAGQAPKLSQVLDDVRMFNGHTSGIPDLFDSASTALNTLAGTAGDLSEELSGLESDLTSVNEAIRRGHNDPGSGDMSDLYDDRDRIEGNIEDVEERWKTACDTAEGDVLGAGVDISSKTSEMATAAFQSGVFRNVLSPGLEGFGALGAATQVMRTGVQSADVLRRMTQLQSLNNRLTTARDFTGSRPERRQQMRRHNRPIRNQLPHARNNLNSSRANLRNNRPLTRAGEVLRNSRNVTRFVRGAGALGVVSGGVDTVNAIRDGDVEGAVTNGVATVGSAMMMFPATAPAGALITAGALAYKHRDKIADGAKYVADKAKDAGNWVKDKASKLKFW